MPTTIRLATGADAEQVQTIYAPYCSTPISFESEPPSVADVRGRIEKTLAQCPWLVCVNGGEMFGYAYAFRHRERAAYRWSIDATVYVRQGQHRRGLGRALYTALFSVLPLQGYVNAYAGVTLPNPGSVGLHRAMGFEPVGIYKHVGFKLGAWYDVAWFQRDLQPLPIEPSDPVPLSEVCETSAWRERLRRGQELLDQATNLHKS